MALSPRVPATALDRDAATETLRLFDCLAPFFVGIEGGVINWSKIPFAHLERDGALDTAKIEAVLPEFERHVAAMAELGYNAVAIDDLAHLVDHPFYPEALRGKLAGYRELYGRLFAIVKAHGLKLFAVTDYLFFNGAIERHLRQRGIAEVDFFRATVEAACVAWPQLDGLVLRIGESDGVDVRGDFTSRLTVRTTRAARALLKTLLPAFEARGKTLVFRTWTLGAYQVGDLMWNRRTYDAVFGEVASPNLVVSLKYGDADFFRYLRLNPLFFHGPQRKIVELQCRREYEGMGEYPSFVGRLYAGYLAELRAGGSNLVGIYALQGGGWAPFRRLAFCGDGSLWNELNAEVTVKLFAGDAALEEIVASFCHRRGIADVDGFLRLLELSDEAIEKGLYVREYARHTIYFRRVRIPPLVWVFWNNVTTGGVIGHLSRYLVRDRAAAVDDGRRAVAAVEEMLGLASRLGLSEDAALSGLRFQLDSFRVLAHLREVLLGVDTPQTHDRLRSLVGEYRTAHPNGYRCDYPAPPLNGHTRRLDLLFPLLLRRQTQYRRGDRLLLNGYVTRLKRYVVRRQGASLPGFVDTQGMSSDVLLR